MQNIIKRIQISLGIVSLPILFIGCGGGDSSFSNSETTVAITIPCVLSPTTTIIDSYVTLNSGDVIVKDTNNAAVSIYHDINGTKKVCLDTASAHIIRK